MKCNSREILEYVYEVTLGDETIIYAPIVRVARKIDPRIECEKRDVLTAELSAKSRMLVEKGFANILQCTESPCGMDRMTILPNYKCNLNCSYCYAARGRADIEIDAKALRIALDWFLDKNRIPGKDLYIHIVGGGEPTISWGVIEEVIRNVAIASKLRRRKIDVAITTNGALITEERACFLAASNILVNVSFEVIREVQNRQRGMYEEVLQTLLMLQKAGCRLAIRSTITPLNVNRMTEMVDVVARRFPRVRRLNLEAIMAGKNVFDSVDSLRSFLTKFRVGFLEAREKGIHIGLNVVSATSLDMTILKERFCFGDLCLTPHGDLVICHRLSSPFEDNYEKTVFGHIERDYLRIDEEAYRRALAFSLESRMDCKDCFLRWHCGGLCIAKQMSFPADYYDVLCENAMEEGFGYISKIANKEPFHQGVPAHPRQLFDLAQSNNGET